MNLDSFKEALDELGIGYKESGVSLEVETCPECESGSYRVLFRVHGVDEDETQFFGRCLRGSCLQGYSSFSYLKKSGMPIAQIRQAHGQDPDSNYRKMTPEKVDSSLDLHLGNRLKAAEEANVEVDTSHFHPVWAMPTHPASIYAVKRGYCDEFKDIMMIDMEANGVVFLINEGQKTVGYQTRYLNPLNKHMKTKTSAGFSKSNKIMHFPREKADLLICEGPFTALSAWHYGYYGVCTFGSSISKAQIELIAALADRLGVGVGYALEDDEAGRKGFAALRSGLHWKGKSLFKVVPEAGSDLNDSWQAGKGCVKVLDNDWAGPAIPYIEKLEL